MTVSSQLNVVSYAGNGVTAIFPVPFYFLVDSDLTVVLSNNSTGAETILTLGTDYTVTGAGVLAGGTVTIPNEPQSGFTLIIRRIVPVTQETDYVSNDPFPAESHERALDKLTMIAQQVSTDVSKAIRVPAFEPNPTALPAIAVRANKLLSFDSNGNPITVAPASGDATSLAIDLANAANPALGAGMVGRATRQIFSVDELRTVEGRYDGDLVELVSYYTDRPGIGGGLLRWDAASVDADDNGMTFTGGVVTGRWKRQNASHRYFSWWGLRPDLADNRPRAQQALDGTPDGCLLEMDNLGEVYPLNCPSGQVGTPLGFVASLYVDNQIRVKGGTSYFKLVDHCDAHNTWDADNTINGDVIMIRNTKAEVRDLMVDANADNQFETDAGVNYWEEGPTGVRPFNGIAVQAQVGQPAIEDVKITNCIVLRPLSGIRAQGTLSFGGPSLDDAGFLGGTLTTDIVINCEIAENFVYRARGNDYLFNSGVRTSRIKRNFSTDSQYHIARLYAGIVDCHIESNEAYVDYARIETRYNPTDLGYWRNDNAAGPNYKIERSGYAIGSTNANQIANAGNVVSCSMKNNKITYRGNISGAAIVDFTQITLASYFVWTAVNSIMVSGNESYNTPTYGLACSIPVTSANNIAQGVTFMNNKIENSGRSAVWLIGSNVHVHDNHFVNCNQPGSGLNTIQIQGSHKVYKNTIEWSRPGVANTNVIFDVIQYGPAGPIFFVSDNMVEGYTGTKITTTGAPIVHGTDGGGVLLTLLAGWAAGPDGTALARITINCAGYVNCEAYINSAAAGTDTFASLNATLVIYRPPINQRFGVWNSTGTVVLGQATAAGSLAIARGALAAGTSFTYHANWKTDFRIAA